MEDHTPTDFLSTHHFSLIIDHDRFKDFEYYLTQVEIPGISASAAAVGIPQLQLKKMPDTIEYDDLSFTFLVEKNMRNWLALWEWMRETIYSDNPKRFDARLIVRTNHNNANIEFTFIDVHPTNLGGITLQTTGSDEATANATLVFDYMKIRNVFAGGEE